jgi:hypothetical protein
MSEAGAAPGRRHRGGGAGGWIRLIWNDLLSNGIWIQIPGKGGGRPEATDEPGFFDDESL